MMNSELCNVNEENEMQLQGGALMPQYTIVTFVAVRPLPRIN